MPPTPRAISALSIRSADTPEGTIVRARLNGKFAGTLSLEFGGRTKFEDRPEYFCGTGIIEEDGPVAVISYAAVVDNFREHGVGRALARAAIDKARLSRVRAIYLFASWDGESTDGFWSRVGFRPTGRCEGESPYMKLDLAA